MWIGWTKYGRGHDVRYESRQTDRGKRAERKGRVSFLGSQVTARQAFMEDRSTVAENSYYIGTRIRARLRLTTQGTDMDVHMCIHVVVPNRSKDNLTDYKLNMYCIMKALVYN